jgi:hypothetical protein
MPALAPTALAPVALTPTALAPRALGAADGETDPLAALDDDFSGTDDLATRGWTIYGGATIATQTISGGELLLESTGGGAADAWWYSQPGFVQDGALIYHLVEGDFDARIRCRQRDAAGTGSPTGGVALEWRFAGLAVHDPAGFVSGAFNFVHIALGGSPNGANRIEWKVNDDDGAGGSQSTFDDVAGSADLDYDLRIERVGQICALSYRRVDSGEPLSSDTGWVALETIEKDANTPARTGGATPIAFPDELAVGIMPPYAGPQTDLDQRFVVEDFRIRTAS